MKTECFESAELSDLGKKRKNNEDSCLRIPEKGVYCVADGMGGVTGGDLASEAITNTIRDLFLKAGPDETGSLSGLIRLFERAVDQASKWIKNYADEKSARGMGSTVVALLVSPRNITRAIALHAGDSRLYQYRNGVLKLLTTDHTAAALLAVKLSRPEKDVPTQYQNQLVRAVGLSDRVELERTLVDVQTGDIFMLCSDGLSRMVPDTTIAEILKQRFTEPVSAIAQSLIDSANQAGGNDNVTVVVLRIGDISSLPKEEESIDLTESKTISTDSSATMTGTTVTTGGGRDEPVTPDSSDTYKGETPHTGDTPDAAGKPITGEGNKSGATRFFGIKDSAVNLLRANPLFGVVLVAAVVACIWCVFHWKRSRAKTQVSISTIVRSPKTDVPGSIFTGAAFPSENPVSNTETTATAVPKAPEKRVVETNLFVAPAAIETEVVHQAEIAPVVINPKVEAPVTSDGTNPSPPPAVVEANGAVVIDSDPPGATVWIESQSQGSTPVTVESPATGQEVTVKYAGLEDRTLKVMAPAGQKVQTNVAFAYGGILIESDPPGAAVNRGSTFLGRTPYTNQYVAVGADHWQLTADEHVPTNVTIEVLDHARATVPVTMKVATGVLALSSNVSNVEAWVDGNSIGALPVNLPITAGEEHAVEAKYKGQQLAKNGICVHADSSEEVWFEFKPLKIWTNQLDMAFVQLPGEGFWAGMARVTPQQYKEVMGGMLSREQVKASCITYVSWSEARQFASKLGTAGLPEDCRAGHYALPTTSQWIVLTKLAQDIGINDVKGYSDWCMTEKGESACGRLSLKEGPEAEQFDDVRAPYITIRVVVVPR